MLTKNDEDLRYALDQLRRAWRCVPPGRWFKIKLAGDAPGQDERMMYLSMRLIELGFEAEVIGRDFVQVRVSIPADGQSVPVFPIGNVSRREINQAEDALRMELARALAAGLIDYVNIKDIGFDCNVKIGLYLTKDGEQKILFTSIDRSLFMESADPAGMEWRYSAKVAFDLLIHKVRQLNPFWFPPNGFDR